MKINEAKLDGDVIVLTVYKPEESGYKCYVHPCGTVQVVSWCYGGAEKSEGFYPNIVEAVKSAESWT